MSIISPIKDTEIEERFWTKVDHSAGTDACWPWTGSVGSHGYGQIKVGQRVVGAHRVALVLSGRRIPKGYYVLHSCDNPTCVNPSHLSAGTASENTRQAYERGLKVPHDTRGERNGYSRLTADDVREIRELHATGRFKLKHLAKRYGVTIANISAIVLRKSWTHI